jgi:hypothetical protein
MPEDKRQNPASSGRLPSPIGAVRIPTPAPVTLPSDLSGSLKYLDDAQIQRLFEAVTAEINRRQRSGSQDQPAVAQATGTSPQSAAVRDKTRGVGEIPEAKENLIRASFRAGMKPASIARTLRIRQAVVSRVLGTTVKPNR